MRSFNCTHTATFTARALMAAALLGLSGAAWAGTPPTSAGIQMLPPMVAGTTTPCSAQSGLILTMTDTGANGASAINCVTGSTLDKVGNFSTNGSGSFGGNGSFGGQVAVGGTLSISGNQVWNTSGSLYLDYQGAVGAVTIGGGGTQQGLNISKGYINIGSTWGSNDVLEMNANQILNANGSLYLNANAPSGAVTIGGGGAQQGLNLASGYMNIGSTWGSSDNLGMNANQILNTNGSLYLNASAPSGAVTIGGGGNNQNLNIPKGQLCLNGTCVSNLNWQCMTATSPTVNNNTIYVGCVNVVNGGLCYFGTSDMQWNCNIWGNWPWPGGTDVKCTTATSPAVNGNTIFVACTNLTNPGSVVYVDGSNMGAGWRWVATNAPSGGWPWWVYQHN